MALAPTPDSVTNQEGADPLEDTSEFDTAFAVAASPEAPAVDAAAGGGAPVQKDGADTSQSGGADPAKPDDQAGAAGEKPPVPGSDVEDIWADVDPKVKAAHEAALAQERHRFASVAGRLSAADRKLAQLQREGGGQREDQGGTGGNAGAAATPTGIKALLETDEMKAARQEYGEVINPVLGLVETLAGEIEALRAGSAGAGDGQGAGPAIEPPDPVQIEALSGLVPDWLSLAGDERLGPWLNTQPAHVRKAAEENWDRIQDGAVAADVFLRFKADHKIGVDPAAGGTGSTVGDRRERQRQGARTAGVTAPTAASGEPDDFDTAFDTAARKLGKGPK